MGTSFEELKEEYISLWKSLALRSTTASRSSAEKLLENKEAYVKAGKPHGIPWWVVGLIHMRESTYNMGRHLHNGDPLTARTSNVPAGRPVKGTPPFTWEESAADALGMKRWKDFKSLTGDTLVAAALHSLEAYNGWGYRTGAGRATIPAHRSPYLWARTNQYSSGKYVADGKFDPKAEDRQQGCAAVLRALVDMGEVSFEDEEVDTTVATIFSNGVTVGETRVLVGSSVEKLTAALKLLGVKTFKVGAGGVPKPPAIDVPLLSKLLRRGSKDGQVWDTQRRLASHGYKIIIDGDFGPATEGTVKLFQTDHLLEVDGVVGEMTWAELWREPSVIPPVDTGLSRNRLATVASAECHQDISWRGNGKAKKYTSKFIPVFGSGRFSWCAAFVTWCVEQCGVNCTGGKLVGQPYTLALCEQWQMWSKEKGFWHDGTAGIETGDIVLFDWDGAKFPDTDWEDHIGIFSGIKENGRLVCYEGNVNDATAVKVREVMYIQGYIRIPNGYREIA